MREKIHSILVAVSALCGVKQSELSFYFYIYEKVFTVIYPEQKTVDKHNEMGENAAYS